MSDAQQQEPLGTRCALVGAWSLRRRIAPTSGAAIRSSGVMGSRLLAPRWKSPYAEPPERAYHRPSMDARSRSTGPSASTTGVKRVAAPEQLRQGGRRRSGWPWLIVGLTLVVVKSEALVELLHHRVEVIALLGLGLAFSVLRTRPVGIALTAAALFAFTLDLSSPALGIVLGFGAFTLLLALFIAIAAVLHARQNPDREGVPRVPD